MNYTLYSQADPNLVLMRLEGNLDNYLNLFKDEIDAYRLFNTQYQNDLTLLFQ